MNYYYQIKNKYASTTANTKINSLILCSKKSGLIKIKKIN